MKQLIGYLKTYYKDEFKWGYGLFILLFTLLLLYLNYFNPSTKVIHRTERWKDTSILYYFTLYVVPFTVAVLAQKLFYKKEELAFLKNPRFWMIVLFGVLLWSLRGSLIYYYTNYIGATLPNMTAKDQVIFRDVFNLLKSSLAFIPIFIYWWFIDKKDQPLYGMHKGRLNLKPYMILLALMIPIIVIASQNPGFLKKYPRAQLMPAVELFNPDHTGYVLSYEMLYILDFYVIELFFRGFMILAFMKVADPKIVLPVAVFYCCIHFGKPFGEALSSLFGGTILGIITYYSRSIWGGIIIHMGIAAAMELSAWLGLMIRH